MGRVLALDVSHNGHPLSDGANVGKLPLSAVRLVSTDGRLRCEADRCELDIQSQPMSSSNSQPVMAYQMAYLSTPI